MTIDTCLSRAQKDLEAAGISTARLDALVLMEDVTGIDRAQLLAEPEHELTAAQVKKLKKLFSLRAQQMPLAYVRGKTEFYGREILITPAVLEPRPESETMIDLLIGVAKALPKGQKLRIADVGTGSGALGITVKLELPTAGVELLEIDPAALEIAKKNVVNFALNISTIQSDLLDGSSKDYDILLCNLPYVPDDYQINLAAGQEPGIAIFGGPDGLDLYRRLFDQIKQIPNKPLYILCESLPPQHAKLATIAKQHDYQLQTTDDFIQVFSCST